MNTANVRQDGKVVILAINGVETVLPWEAALEIAKHLREKAKAAEEWARAISGELITDQAIVTRIGLPFGLTSHPKIQAEAAKEAAWNSDLRRYLPGGVKSKEMVGAPTLKHHQPTPEQQAADAAFWAKKKGQDNGST